MPMQIEHEGKNLTVYTEDEVQQRVDDEVAGLKTTNQQLKDEKQQLKDDKKELQGQLDTIESEKTEAEKEKARRDGDYEKLEQLLERERTNWQNQLEQERNERKKEKVENAVSDIVHRLGAGGTKNEDLRDLIKTRFEFDYDSETGKVTVAGDGIDGLESLEKQISESGRYDAYIAGSQASGGNAPGSQGGGAASKNPEDMTEQERVELFNSDPAKFRELFNT